MYAIVNIADKQFKVSKNDTLYVPLLDAKEGAAVTFEDVLLVSDKAVKVGQPTVAGAKVKAKVLAHVKGDKILVFKKKRRKRYKVKRGHRQWYTQLEISDVSVGAARKSAAKKDAADAPKTETAAKKTTTAKKAAAPKKETAAKKAAPKKAAAPKKEAAAKKTTTAKKAAPKKEAAAKKTTTAKKAAPKKAAPKKAAPKKKADDE